MGYAKMCYNFSGLSKQFNFLVTTESELGNKAYSSPPTFSLGLAGGWQLFTHEVFCQIWNNFYFQFFTPYTHAHRRVRILF